MRCRRWVWNSAAFLMLAAPAMGAALPKDSEQAGSVALPQQDLLSKQNPARQIELGQRLSWRQFQARYGDWKAVWNEAAASPHRAFGPGIALESFHDDAPSVDHAVRQFVGANAGVFGGAPTLELVTLQRLEHLWHVRYRQTVNGIPILFADWEFEVGTNGRLSAFGADAYRITRPVRTSPTLVGAVAREAAKSGLKFDTRSDRVEGGKQLYLLPYPGPSGLEYRLVYEVIVVTSDPPGNWRTFVDTETGELLWRQNRVRYVISGTVTGTVHALEPTDPLTSKPFPHLYVTVGGNIVPTDASGAYSAPAAGTVNVTAQIHGLYCDVNRQDAPDASFSTSTTDPATINVAWGTTNSQDAERDAYISVNVTHDHIKTVEPGFTGLDYEMPTAVNILTQTCNAYWNGTGVNFFAAGDGCVNSATVADIIYHEYGHGINDRVYAPVGGMMNGALHEGTADLNAAFIRDDPLIGKGLTGPGTFLRNLVNTNRWPDDATPDPHATGLIIGGACWDLRQSLGLSITEHLVHFTKHLFPDDAFFDGGALSAFFSKMLTTDDDDANLANGTPHSNQIIAAFNAHGIGTGYFVNIAHTAVTDQSTAGMIPVTATVQYTGPPVAHLDTSSPTVHYSINNAAFQTEPMLPTGTANQFRARIPGPAASVVRYYISATDNFGAGTTSPAVPARDINTFVVGPASTVFLQNMETDPGWTVGAVDDNATTGIWERVNPNGTYFAGAPVQPEDDHTPGQSDTTCWVTGQSDPGAERGVNDVDGGKTTLTTNLFSAATGGFIHPVIEYYRWYTNNTGSNPGTDVWRTYISNDNGANWVPVENTDITDNSWRRVVFRIEDYVTPTANMKMRFVASDEDGGSIVEAAVDDFRLIGFPTTLAVGGNGPTRQPLALAPASPNPFARSTTLRFMLPNAGTVSLMVYDIHGRLVRSLVNGAREAGAHAVDWDGRDQAGHPVQSGAYYLRLAQAGHQAVETVVRLQ